MSAQAGSIGAIVLGVVVGAVGLYTGQYYLLFTAATLIAGGAIGLSYKPKSDTGANAQAQELRVATAAIGNPVPVVFGEARVTPNFLRVEPEQMTVEKIEKEAEGGKGGGSQPKQFLGYDYYVPWEMGLCMGPVDEVGQVYSMPGEVWMIDADEAWTAFDGSGQVELALDNRDEDAPESGLARVFDGRANQVRPADHFSDDGISYRHLCWVLMGISAKGFYIGRTPQPKTYQFMIRRLPKPYRDDNTLVPMEVRGSTDSDDPSYVQANPAAIIYEAMTNKVWGRGLSSDLFDEDSFIFVAEYLAAKNIGMSLLLEGADNMADLLEGIFRHCKVLLTWDGELYKVMALTDQRTTHGEILTLSESDLSNFRLNVPLWETSTTNELRGEFTSALRGYRSDMVHIQDLANVAILEGRTVSERINLPGFADYNLAFRQLARIMSEMSYPFHTAEWEMNRFGSHLQVGNVVRVIWKEFTENPVTTYWMILRITDGASADENIKVSAVQDPLIFPVEGEELDVTVPTVHSWERIAEVDESLVYKQPDITRETDPITPVTSFELGAIAMQGAGERTIITGEKVHPAMTHCRGLWSYSGATYESLGSLPAWAITGTLIDAMPADEYWNRSAGYEFTITNTTLGAAIQGANIIQSDNDDLETLLAAGLHWLIVGDELMQVGLIEHVSGSTYRLRNIIRGRLGCRARHHATGATIFYMPQPSSGFDTRALPYGALMWFQAQPVGNQGPTADGTNFRPYHYGDNNERYLAMGRRPLPPRAVDIAEDVTTIALTCRPRYFNQGGGVRRFLEAIVSPSASLGGMTFATQQYNAAGAAIDTLPVDSPHVFTAPTIDTPAIVEVTLAKASGVAAIRLYSKLDGRLSAEYAHFTL